MSLTVKEDKILKYFKKPSDKMSDLKVDLEEEDFNALNKLSVEKGISIEDMMLIVLGEFLIEVKDTDKFQDLRDLVNK